MKSQKKSLVLAVASFLAVVGAMFIVTSPAKAAILGSDNGDTKLEDLILLNQLSGTNSTSGLNIFGTNNQLGNLLVLDKVFSNSGSGILGGDNKNLGDLVVLNQLFNNNGTMSTQSDLTNLILLDKISGDNGGILSGSNGSNDLGDLVVLNSLFSGNLLGGNTTVTVQTGDTLSKIAERTLGNASLYPSIATLNNISNPNLIYPGQVLKIPSTTTSTNGSLNNLILLDALFN